jgi:amino acid transporter
VALWLIAGAFFFVPSALAVAALARRYPVEGGLYVWARESFGEWHGFLCGFTYVLSNLLYFVSLSLAIISVGATLIGGVFSDGAMLVGALALIWAATIISIAGGRVSKWIGNLTAAFTCITATALVVTGIFSASHGFTTAITSVAWDWQSLNLWSQLAFAYVGLELGAVMAGETRDPLRTIPRAAILSGIAIATFYVFGTLAVLSLLSPPDVSPVIGLAQAFQAAERRFSIPGFGMVFSVTTMIAMTGQLGAWIAGGGRLPFVIGLDRYLPPLLGALHPRFGTPWVALVAQAVAASVLGIAFAAGETTRAAYQLLVDVTVLLTFIPFLYIFAASWKGGLRSPAVMGLLVTLLAMALSVVPPPEAASIWLFELKVVGGSVLLIGCGWLNYRYAKRAGQGVSASPVR